jgi:hypothetical protein
MKDMIGRELAVGDFVGFYGNLYEVTALGKSSISGHGYAKIMIHPASKTSRPVSKYSREMVRIPAEDVTMHLLKQGRL